MGVGVVNLAVWVSGILVLAAGMVTVVLWREEGRRGKQTPERPRRTAISRPDEATRATTR